MSTPTTRATQYTVSLLPDDHIDSHLFDINVEYRGDGKWGVVRMRQCLGADGEWDYESIPSEREDEWLATHRFDLETALRLAEQAAPSVRCNGRTADDHRLGTDRTGHTGPSPAACRMTPQPIPMHSMDIVGLTDDLGDPTSGVQFAVVEPDGGRFAYGDQSWVAFGDVLRLVHPDGKIQRRTITITYGEWEDQ